MQLLELLPRRVLIVGAYKLQEEEEDLASIPRHAP
jgi:hypothetical protein